MAALTLLFFAGGPAWGQAVIMNGNYFLTHNEAGTSVNSAATTSFNPATCLWVYASRDYIRTANSEGNAIANNNNYLQYSSLSLGSDWGNWYRGNNNEDIYYREYNWGWTYYYLQRNNTTWQIGGSSSNNGQLKNCTVTSHNAVDNITSPTISINSASGNTINFSHTNIGGTYTSAYTTYRFNNANHQWYDGSDHGTTTPSAVNANSMSPTYKWSIQTGGSYASIDEDDGVLTLGANVTGNIVVRLTVSNTTPAFTKTVDFTLTRASIAQNVSSTTTLTNPSLNLTSATLESGENQTFSTTAVTATTTTTTVPAHTTLTGGGNTYYYYNGTLYTSTDDFMSITETHPAVTYNWALAGTGSSNLSLSTNSGTSTTVTHTPAATTDGTATLTLTASASGESKTATATIKVYAPVADPTITRTGNNISLATTSLDATIYYTTDGTTPSESNGTAYTTPFELTSSPTTVKAVTIRGGQSSGVTSETFQLTVATPVITINQSTGAVTITCATEGATIHYTYGDNPDDPTSSDPIFSSQILTSGQTIKAIATKTDYDNSAIARQIYVTSGVSGTVVTLNDLEDHSWSYYSDPECPIRSLSPADVKITYYGDGIVMTGNADYTASSVEGTNYVKPGNENYVGGAKVNVGGENENTFVYYKTLERGDATQTAWTYSSGSQSSAASRCPYTTIYNPFQVRPTYGERDVDANNFTGWRGFQCWRLKSVSGGAVYSAASGGTALSAGAIINGETQIYFAPNSEYGMEVELEAVWARAYLIKGNQGGANAILNYGNLGVERNFMTLTAGQSYRFNGSSGRRITNVDRAVTISSYYPNGEAPDGTNNTITGNDNNITLGADTKFENVTLSAGSYTLTASGYDVIVGRGCTSTNIGTVRGLSDGTSGTIEYTIRLESGTFGTFNMIDGTTHTHSGTVSARTIFGCDYDRAKEDNSKLSIAANSTVYGASQYQQFSSNTNRNNLTYEWLIKSGTVQSSKGVADGAAANCIYMGNSGNGNDSDGNRYQGKRRLVMEGGEVCNISGGLNNYGNNYANYIVNDGWAVQICIKGGTVRGAIFGAAAFAGASGDRLFIFTGGTINGWVAGGANGTQNSGGELYGSTALYIGGNTVIGSSTGGTHVGGYNATYGTNGADGGHVFGAGCGILPTNGNFQNGTVGRVDNSTIVVADNAHIWRDVHGGGNYGWVRDNGSTGIYIAGGTIGGIDGYGNVFGGSNNQQGQEVGITVKGGDVKGGVYGGSHSWGTINDNVTMSISGGLIEQGAFGGGYGTNSNSCDVDGTVGITMTGGTVLTGLYGGGNINSTVGGAATINIYGGTIGADAVDSANVHGGGLGSRTRMLNNVAVNIGENVGDAGATIHGDVYGGSAEGKTNGNSSRENNATTAVTVKAGTIFGSVYGGGLGASNAADVYGPVTVTFNGGSVKDPETGNPASVFGCNNSMGSPQNTVEVFINGSNPTEVVAGVKHYAINGVYGGGNQAHYDYDNANYPTVTVTGCNTSIRDVYGGGNAAAVPSTHVTIQGGDIDRVFGGGNGESNVPAHVGYKNKTENSITSPYTADGAVSVTINGGTINQVFGGSNAHGTIKGAISVSAVKSGTCAIAVHELYGGGNEANSAVGSISIGCMEDGDMIDYVYGGANQADINGNINLTMTGGRVGNLFGGNNTSGAVIGGINVTVNWTTGNEACSNNYLGNVFGGGNLATYTIPNEKALTVNIKNGTVSGNVYGGGKGKSDDHSKGAVTGNPQVTIGDNVDGHQVTVSGSVFGGGDAGNVSGTPVVNVVEKCNTVITTAVYGGGNAADVTGTSVTINGGTIGDVFGGGNGAVAAANVTGSTSLTIHGGTIAHVFAGGNKSGTINNNTGVTIDHTSSCDQAIDEVYGGGNEAAGNAGTVSISCSAEHIGDVYGGANQANVTNDITLNITGGQINNVFGGNNTSGSISGGITVNINKATDCNTFSVNNVYGGGNLAQYAIPNNKALAVNILNGTVSQNVYGGGKGDPSDHTMGQVTGNPTVTIGDLTSGHESYVATVTGDVYGGGDAGNVVGTPVVTVENKCNTSVGYVYGGGNAADVSGTNVTINGGTIVHDVFGGGHGDKASLNVGLETGHSDKVANVSGNASVTITGGTIDRVFAGSNINGTINGTSNVLSINKSASAACDMKIREVYGGGNLAAGNATTISVGCTGSIVNGNNGHAAHPENIGISLEGIGTVFGGANNANIGAEGAGNESDITLNINSGMVANVFGGNNNGGTIYGDITVNIEKTSDACGWYVGNVYGAGNLAPYTGSPAVNVKNGTVSQNVYGGGKGASAVVTGNPVVTIGDATVAYAAIVSGDVYGGGDAAAVTGNSSVTYNDANASSSVARLFGGGNAAGVSGTAGVTLTNGKVTGGVYGGCNSSGSVGAVTVALNGGQVGTDALHADVYGGGYGASTSTTGNIGVTLNGTTVYGDLYGGSALGSVNANTSNTTTVTLTSATLHGSVFGGGKGDGGTTATSEGQAIVNINVYDQYLTGIYGGANVRGLVKGDIAVNVNANVGASGGGNSLDIFGGGYGAATNTKGNVTVTIGNEAGTIVPTIYGDIYGGSALGNVNDAAADVTTVNFLNGTLHGNLYGGGLGDVSNAAKVNGQVVVNISNTTQTEGNCHIDLHEATIYGCNNTNGSPQDNVTVNIYKTAHTTTNAATYTENDGVNGVPTYAIDQVFGGGNRANYLPENGAANSTKKTTVNVYGCTNTIRRLFSGGNAAAATGVAAEIEGGRFDWVFGGGNGEVDPANIGNGGTNLQVHGGTINNLFGGSNARGTITGQMNVAVDADGACGSDMYVAEFYCGNNLANVGTEDNHTNIVASVGCGAVFGDVYGGCKMANIFGNVTLTIYGGTINTVYGGSKGDAGTPANITGNVTLHIYGGDIGNVFGGSNINGNITGTIAVDVDWNHTGSCAGDAKQIDNVYGGSNLALYTPTDATITSPLVTLTNGCVGRSDFDGTDPGAHGRVFGGGKGSTDNINAGKVTANPKVLMNPTAGGALGVYNGTTGFLVKNAIYGGGEVASVVGSTMVQIDKGHVGCDEKLLSHDNGFVFGGGMGYVGNYLLANVSANCTVTMSGGYVHNTLFGGGEMASVGTYGYADAAYVAANPTFVLGEQNSCANGTGTTTVNISGGQIGPVNVTMEADLGYVFGAGQGYYTQPEALGFADPSLNSEAEGYNNARFGYVNNAVVNISENALIVGAVWGGSENGQVLNDCRVNISGGQIGVGDGKTGPYTDEQWTAAINAVKAGDASAITTAATAMPECKHWQYRTPYLPYDAYIDNDIDVQHTISEEDRDASTANPGDGHTFFGNVFGGGSGYYPYRVKHDDNKYYSHFYAFQGRVRGNTYVNITGGHILTSVYGGCEYADVLGNTNVTMSGGTLGVPRTVAQILAHPVTCYLFGGGKGDQRTSFNDRANVNNATVLINNNAFIFGSVFGGGEDGHVHENTSVTITGNAWVGNWGTSYYDGNIFGGGRGFGGTTLNAGSISGNAEVNIDGNCHILGNIYGGGRLASVGLNIVHEGGSGYGELLPDDGEDDPLTLDVDESKNHGHITINISGGTIGNSFEFTHPAFNPANHYYVGDVVYYQNEMWRFTHEHTGAWDHNDATDVVHTTGGNVFGSSMGRLLKIGKNDDQNPDNFNHLWPGLAKSRTTEINISDGTIYSNVYGGGELGYVMEHAKVSISGGTIGHVMGEGTMDACYFGSVFGGGYGSDNFVHHTNDSADVSGSVTAAMHAGRVYGNTEIEMTGGLVLGNIYGGGELASVGRRWINITSSEDDYTFIPYTGTEQITVDGFPVYPWNENIGNTKITISGGTVGDVTHTTVDTHRQSGWVAGKKGGVFGGGKGRPGYYDEVNDIDYGFEFTRMAYVDKTDVTIRDNARIAAVVFGGGENGHVRYNTKVTMTGGLVGVPLHITEYAMDKYGYSPVSVYQGNIYGGGRGVDVTSNGHLGAASGQVFGNTAVTISGGQIYHNVYGGGSLATVGTMYDDGTMKVGTGRTDVTITGNAIIGDASAEGRNSGAVFGSGRGVAGADYASRAYVNNTYVTIGADSPTGTCHVYGNVFGGGENGHVEGHTHVYIKPGCLIGEFWDDVDAHDAPHEDFVGNVYGGGRGVDLESGQISRTAGWVRGSTHITITGGHIFHNVFGGGSLANVGDTLNLRGVYAQYYDTMTAANGDAYNYDLHKHASYTAADFDAATANGHSYIFVSGGEIGINGDKNGSVFGGGRGTAGHSNYPFAISPLANPTAAGYDGPDNNSYTVNGVTSNYDFYTKNEGGKYTTYRVTNLSELGYQRDDAIWVLGKKRNNTSEPYQDSVTLRDYTNHTYVTGAHVMIAYPSVDSTTLASPTGNYATDLPTAATNTTGFNMVHGSVYGGGDNGHVRGKTEVRIDQGRIGTLTGQYNGNVFGGGSGEGRSYDGEFSEDAGRVFGATSVTINGGWILHNVYGGGNMAGVGDFDVDLDQDGNDQTIESTSKDDWLNGNGTVIGYTVHDGTTVVTINGGHIGEKFFDIVQNEKVDGKWVVRSGMDSRSANHGGNVFGSSRGQSISDELVRKMAWVNLATVTVNNTSAPAIMGSVFGGGENGHVFYTATVNINGGTIGVPNQAASGDIFRGNVYGGGRGIDPVDGGTNFSRTSGLILGNTYVNMTSGTVYRHVFGGGSMATVGTYSYVDNNTSLQRIETVQGEEVVVNKDSIIDLQRPETGKTEVHISGGTVGINGINNGSVFGAGRGVAGLQGELMLDEHTYVDRTYVTIVDGTIHGNVFGSGDNGHVLHNTQVVVSGGTIGSTNSDNASKKGASVQGNVFGSGRGADTYLDNAVPTLSPNAGRVHGNSEVYLVGGTLYNNVYGGGYLATVHGNTHITVNTTANVMQEVWNYTGVIPTLDNNASHIDVTSTDATPHAPVVYGDVFGGSALGELGTAGNTTVLDILNGTIGHSDSYKGSYGNIFGGGNGDAETHAMDSYGGGTTDGHRDANVLNTITVNIGAIGQQGNNALGPKILGDVFGGNNVAGSPKGNVSVNVYSTHHTAADDFAALLAMDQGDDTVADLQAVAALLESADPDDVDAGNALFALDAVYGGGNAADYVPADVANNTTTVTIYGCTENTIKYVYGGGKAASVNETHVIIHGGHIYRVFAGGDGSAGAPGAHIGYRTVGTTPYGGGNTDLLIQGGAIFQAFGGSNTYGQIAGTTTVNLDQEGACPLNIVETFGGNNRAESEGDREVTIHCGTKWNDVYGGNNEARHHDGNIKLNILGGQINRAFGGSRAANIEGNVEVNVFGGSIKAVYGGNNVSGNITGTITVNIDSNATNCSDPWDIDTVYGGGNEAAYTPNDPTTTPMVNLIHGKVDVAVFGGGYGAGATVTANPQVTIGAWRKYHLTGGGTTITPVVTPAAEDKNLYVRVGGAENPVGATLEGNVFGGGNAASVSGNTKVIIQGNNTMVWHNVYGGGNAAEVTGNTDVEIGKE